MTSPPSSTDTLQNRLLASLPEEDYDALRPRLEAIDLPYRRVLYEAKKPIDFVYFLETGVGSLVSTMRNGDAAEVGTIGNEGFVGLPVLFGDRKAPTSVYMPTLPLTSLGTVVGSYRIPILIVRFGRIR